MRTAGHMERLYFERKLHVQPLSLDYVWLRDGCCYYTVLFTITARLLATICCWLQPIENVSDLVKFCVNCWCWEDLVRGIGLVMLVSFASFGCGLGNPWYKECKWSHQVYMAQGYASCGSPFYLSPNWVMVTELLFGGTRGVLSLWAVHSRRPTMGMNSNSFQLKHFDWQPSSQEWTTMTLVVENWFIWCWTVDSKGLAGTTGLVVTRWLWMIGLKNKWPCQFI